MAQHTAQFPENTPVEVRTGHFEGETGRVALFEPEVGYYWVFFDRFADDRVYRGMHYGPFVARELKQIMGVGHG